MGKKYSQDVPEQREIPKQNWQMQIVAEVSVQLS
jgi:hypothetical protein